MLILHEDFFSQRSECRVGYEVVQEMKWDGVDGGVCVCVVFSSCSVVFSSSNKSTQLLLFFVVVEILLCSLSFIYREYAGSSSGLMLKSWRCV